MKTICNFIFERSSKKTINEKLTLYHHVNEKLRLNNSFMINERLSLNNQSKLQQVYHYHPKTYEELLSLLNKLLEERGKDADLNDIDVSQIDDMTYLFHNVDIHPHNIDISKWDVREVRSMCSMFWQCWDFNCNLSQWDVRNVTDMSAMFRDCENFEGVGLENWKKNWKTVPDTHRMFDNCESLKNIPSWYKE